MMDHFRKLPSPGMKHARALPSGSLRLSLIQIRFGPSLFLIERVWRAEVIAEKLKVRTTLSSVFGSARCVLVTR